MEFAMRNCNRGCFHFLRHDVPFIGSWQELLKSVFRHHLQSSVFRLEQTNVGTDFLTTEDRRLMTALSIAFVRGSGWIA